MKLKNLLVVFGSFLLLTALTACDDEVLDESANGLQLELRHDQATGKLNVIVHPSLGADRTLHVRVRNGYVGQLECAQMADSIPRIDGAGISLSGDGQAFSGPHVDPAVYNNPYNTDWLGHVAPTPEMIHMAQNSAYTVDICIMGGGLVVRQAEMDIRRALDRSTTGKFDGYDEEEIVSTVAYAEACVSQLGEIPFFPKLADKDYGTFNCLDATPIPTTVTDENGNVTYPEEEVPTCDNPQFIYSLCEPNAVNGRTNGPRVTSADNEQGTHWVLLCRKSKAEEGQYNDMAMLGHNPYTGKTCFFQNALYSRTNGLAIPHPGDSVDSPQSPQQSAAVWNAIHGGLGSGIECAECHDADPFIHTPWIDGAKNERGDTVIAKMGTHDGFAEGYTESPYTIVNTQGQGWTMPKHLTSPEAAPCTKCHRMGNGRWTKSWISRLIGKNTPWDDKLTTHGRDFDNVFWMPPDLEALDHASWDESDYGRAVQFLRDCVNHSTGSPSGRANPDPACKWEDLPKEQIIAQGELPEVALEEKELAAEALKILGANLTDPNDPRCNGEGNSCRTRRCSECHSVSKAGLKHWKKLSDRARSQCGLDKDPETLTPEEALKNIDCLRSHPDDPNSVFAADKVGILTTGASYGYFRKLFRKAYADNWLPKFVNFKARVGMPKGTYAKLSQKEHAVLLKWFGNGLKNMNDILVDPPAPETCEPFVDALAMANHVNEMKVAGWGAKNKDNSNFFNFGCDIEGKKCFSNSADRSAEWGNKNGNLKEILKLGFKSSFWTRSSADGRFVANGGGVNGGSTITDMQKGIDIKVKASYDPGFFPDNSGFIFQGGGTGICPQSVLEAGTEIDFKDPSCMRASNINLYQHVARGIDGDYFVINSQFTSDSGGNSKDPNAFFNAGSSMKFSPMIFNGVQYEQLPAQHVDSPYEGDSVLSPSGRLVISRLSGGADGAALGYVIREVKTSKQGQNYKVSIDKVVARVCAAGAKANISFDERYFVTHQYEDGTANIYLYDMVTGQGYKVTNMPKGLKALFPHFRSDGWFYFLVKGNVSTPVTGPAGNNTETPPTTQHEEFILASDLAVQLLVANQ